MKTHYKQEVFPDGTVRGLNFTDDIPLNGKYIFGEILIPFTKKRLKKKYPKIDIGKIDFNSRQCLK
jgi:hypothetical protein